MFWLSSAAGSIRGAGVAASKQWVEQSVLVGCVSSCGMCLFWVEIVIEPVLALRTEYPKEMTRPSTVGIKGALVRACVKQCWHRAMLALKECWHKAVLA